MPASFLAVNNRSLTRHGRQKREARLRAGRPSTPFLLQRQSKWRVLPAAFFGQV
jgi:hypothetical protein